MHLGHRRCAKEIQNEALVQIVAAYKSSCVNRSAAGYREIPADYIRPSVFIKGHAHHTEETKRVLLQGLVEKARLNRLEPSVR